MGEQRGEGQDQMQREGVGPARAGDAQTEGQEGLKEDKWGRKSQLKL